MSRTPAAAPLARSGAPLRHGARTRTKALIAALAMGAAGLGGTLLGATPAQAAPPMTNGCTNSPDSGYAPFRFDFHEACNDHDLCYGLHSHGSDAAGRAACDRAFLDDLRASCRAEHGIGIGRPSCEVLAAEYYVVVRAAGWHFFPEQPVGTVTVGPLEPLPPAPPVPEVTVGPIEVLPPPAPSGGGSGGGFGGGGGPIGGSGGGGGGGTPTVTVGEPEAVDTQAE